MLGETIQSLMNAGDKLEELVQRYDNFPAIFAALSDEQNVHEDSSSFRWRRNYRPGIALSGSGRSCGIRKNSADKGTLPRIKKRSGEN